MNFTKDQIEFIKELLRRQRDNCLVGYHNAHHLEESEFILNAPEPALPEAVEQEPYGYVNDDTKVFMQTDQYNDKYLAVYLHPAPIVFPTEEEINSTDFGYGNTYRDMKKGFLLCIDTLKSKIENK